MILFALNSWVINHISFDIKGILCLKQPLPQEIDILFLNGQVIKI